MINLIQKTNKIQKSVKNIFILTTFSFLFLNISSSHAGKFEEMILGEEGISPKKRIILQFDDDEGRRKVGATIEIGKVENLIAQLDASINDNLKRGNKIAGVDLSNTDLINEDLIPIVNLLISKLKTIDYLNLSDTHTDAKTINLYTKHIPSLLGNKTKKLTEFYQENKFYMPLVEYL